MSYSVVAYALDLAALREVVAQPAHPARAGLTVDLGTRQGQALAALLGASPPPNVTPAELGYALRELCRQLGTELTANGLSGIRSAFLERAEREVDVIYASTGFSLRALVEGGSPVALPPMDDFPAIGYAEHDAVARADAFCRSDDPTHDDSDIDQVLVDLADWLGLAAARTHGLVAFYA